MSNSEIMMKNLFGRSTRSIIKLGLIISTAIIAGCASHDKNMMTGSISDDYRARHPIVIADKDVILDLPISNFPSHMTALTKDTIAGFAHNYRKSGATQILVLHPTGASNSHKAGHYANLVADALANSGVPRNQISISTYDSEVTGGAAPIKLVYTALTASTNPCGNWNADLFSNLHENRNYENFGCATQNNLAAQIANPLDLIAPRGTSPIDATRRATAIGTYQENGAGLGL